MVTGLVSISNLVEEGCSRKQSIFDRCTDAVAFKKSDLRCLMPQVVVRWVAKNRFDCHQPFQAQEVYTQCDFGPRSAAKSKRIVTSRSASTVAATFLIQAATVFSRNAKPFSGIKRTPL